jgi:hypothetical protein
LVLVERDESVRRIFIFTLIAILPVATGRAEMPTLEALRHGVDRAVEGVRALQAESGGWGRIYTRDGAAMWGEWKLVPRDWITVQPPCTPTTAMTLLRAGQVLDKAGALEGADRARKALLTIQTPEGGFPHEAPPSEGARATATFDDDVTTSALRFLMAWWQHTGDASDRAEVDRVGAFLMASQYETCGLWPQRYPPGDSGYGRDITFNDNVAYNNVHALMQLEKVTGEARYGAAIDRAGACILKLQGGEGEAVWAQQYDPESLAPSWARKFEPPGYSAGESAGMCRLLVDLYRRDGDERYLEALRRALHWYDTHKLENGRWARLYEPGTQRPVYGRRDKAEKVYDLEKATDGYAWQGNWYPQDAAAALARFDAEGGEALRARSDTAAGKRTVDGAAVARVLAALDKEGYWTRRPSSGEKDLLKEAGVNPDQDLIDMGMFNRNLNLLLDALEAGQGGDQE